MPHGWLCPRPGQWRGGNRPRERYLAYSGECAIIVREQRHAEPPADELADGAELRYLDRDIGGISRFAAPPLGELAQVVAGRIGDEGLTGQFAEPHLRGAGQSMVFGNGDVYVLGTYRDVVQSFWRRYHDGKVQVAGEQLRTEFAAVGLLEQHADAGVPMPEGSQQIGDVT